MIIELYIELRDNLSEPNQDLNMNNNDISQRILLMTIMVKPKYGEPRDESKEHRFYQNSVKFLIVGISKYFTLFDTILMYCRGRPGIIAV